jgi:hypothetical protein
MNITSFRTANLDDVAVLVQLVNSAYHPEPGIGSWTDESGFFFGTRTSKQSLQNMLVENDSIVLLGLHEDAIIACVHLEKSENHAQLGMLAVNPVVSVDTKKKELIGNLSRDGKIYTTETIEVFDHDFPSLAEGVAIPHTVYDTVQNKAYVTIGTSRDTSVCLRLYSPVVDSSWQIALPLCSFHTYADGWRWQQFFQALYF